MKSGAAISSVLKSLSSSTSQVYLSQLVQVADLLDWILGQVGPAEVWLTSFSISEEFLRRLYFIEKSGNVSKFHLVLDHKATNKTIKLWTFISQVISKTYLADNHSKILLVKAQSGDNVTVVTSQNLTRGNRYEAAIITTDHIIFDKLQTQVNDLIRNHSVPLTDLMANRLTAL